MSIAHINTHDTAGGAARAAYRLHSGLRAIGQDSSMFVANRESDDPAVVSFAPPQDLPRRLLRGLRRRYLQHRLARYDSSSRVAAELFTEDRTQHGAEPFRQLPAGDIIHLHWVADLLDYRPFFRVVARRTPLVWTLHDMNPFTGGCHYDYGCGKYRNHCGACPQLGSRETGDLSSHVWQRKREAYEQVAPDRLHVVTPSRWLAAEVRGSGLMGRFPVSVIPNGLDINSFAPRDRTFARGVLGVPLHAKVILFVADHISVPRKGFSALAQVLTDLAGLPDLCLLSVGRGAATSNIPIPHLALGPLSTERLLSQVYSAADVHVVPTRADNLPNTVLESMACGVPIVGFDVGGVSDMVRDGITGLLASEGDLAELGNAS